MAKITIFGLAGTGTSSVGRKLSHDLGYLNISSGGMFRKKAESLGLTLYEFEAVCNKDPAYDFQLDEELKKYGKEHKDFVLESRLAWYLIPDSFKIKFVCDNDERMRRVANRDGISVEVAKEKSTIRDADIAKRFTFRYGKQEYAPDKVFDLIIDTTHNPVHKITEEIKKAIFRANNVIGQGK